MGHRVLQRVRRGDGRTAGDHPQVRQHLPRQPDRHAGPLPAPRRQRHDERRLRLRLPLRLVSHRAPEPRTRMAVHARLQDPPQVSRGSSRLRKYRQFYLRILFLYLILV